MNQKPLKSEIVEPDLKTRPLGRAAKLHSLAEALSFESVARLHMAAAPERQDAGLHAWEAALMGNLVCSPKNEPLYTLAEIAKQVRKHPTWLHKLEIQKHAGERLAGRFMYRKSAVLEYLQSEACQDRIQELARVRRAREGTKRKGCD